MNLTPGGRSSGRERTRTQRREHFLVWALAHGARVRRLLDGICAEDAPSLRAVAQALEAADVPTPSGRYEWHPTTVARALDALQVTSTIG